MKKLHQMKLSEIFKAEDVDVMFLKERIDHRLKEWAIAKIKNCERTVDCTTNNPCGTIGGHKWKKGIPKESIERCDICRERMNDFELTEKDLQ